MQFRNNIKTPFTLSPPSKLIIDTHGGLQDILAIVLAHRLIQQLGTGQQIIGITCVAGKNSVEDAVKSALVVNRLLGTKIPVFKGQKQTLMLKTQYPPTYMNQNFVDIEQTLYKDLQQDKNISKLVAYQKAIDFIIRSCKQHRENLGVIALGPLTNLGLAHRLENCLTAVKMVSLTGGQYMGMGNTVVGHIQANFAHDPLAAHILFQIKHDAEYLKDKIYVNVIQKTMQYSLKLALNTCIDSGKLEPKLSEIFQNMLGINSIVINCGPLLTVVPFIQPKAVKSKHHVYAEIVRDGQNTDGLLAINWLRVGAKKGEFESFVCIYEDYDHSMLNQLFVLAFTSLGGRKS